MVSARRSGSCARPGLLKLRGSRTDAGHLRRRPAGDQGAQVTVFRPGRDCSRNCSQQRLTLPAAPAAPSAGSVHQCSPHLRARGYLDLLEGRRVLVDAPVAFSRDEAGGASIVRPEYVCNVGGIPAAGRERYHWQPALEPGPRGTRRCTRKVRCPAATCTPLSLPRRHLCCHRFRPFPGASPSRSSRAVLPARRRSMT